MHIKGCVAPRLLWSTQPFSHYFPYVSTLSAQTYISTKALQESYSHIYPLHHVSQTSYFLLLTNMEDSLPHPHQHFDGATHWHHRHRLPWACRRGRIRRISPWWHLLYHRVYARIRIQHRSTNTHGASQW